MLELRGAFPGDRLEASCQARAADQAAQNDLLKLAA
jgi:hypothetical protein